ncbi:MAG: sodium:alanine symporter family protein [Clostridia bacterium]|nr:sodium:alanine symporter family protein [Clostridia bacterium]
MEVLSVFFAFMVLASGAFITVRLGFFQFTHFFRAISTVLSPQKTPKNGGSVSPFQALAAALGGSIGTANIAGVASALALGGAGAVFYMWLATLVGMAVKFSEIVLAVKYREKRGGAYLGGPMLYIEKGLCNGRGSVRLVLARAFAFFGLVSSCVGTPLVQANTIAESFSDMLGAFKFGLSPSFTKPVCGAILALIVGLVVIGGIRRIGRVSEIVVPFMALGYVAVCLVVLIRFRTRLIPSIGMIFASALSPRAAFGGAAGFGIMRAMRVGIARGVYSNEAGVGSAPMAHACAETRGSVQQGLYGIFEVFADTLVMCTLTALVVLASGVKLPAEPYASGTGIALSAFSSVLGEKTASIFLAVSLLLFAFTSIIAWSVYGLNCAKYLFGERVCTPYRIVFTLLCAVGTLIRSDIVWRGGEMLNYLMAAPNLVALVFLTREVEKEVAFTK